MVGGCAVGLLAPVSAFCSIVLGVVCVCQAVLCLVAQLCWTL